MAVLAALLYRLFEERLCVCLVPRRVQILSALDLRRREIPHVYSRTILMKADAIASKSVWFTYNHPCSQTCLSRACKYSATGRTSSRIIYKACSVYTIANYGLAYAKKVCVIITPRKLASGRPFRIGGGNAHTLLPLSFASFSQTFRGV